jgi:hypothetical protein
VREIGETFLFLLTPFLALALWGAWPSLRKFEVQRLASARAGVWLWLLSPVLILILHPLKEPRHVAASIVPAVLLVVMGFEGIADMRRRSAARVCAVLLAAAQYLAVTHGLLETPYFMDRALAYDDLREQILKTDERPIYRLTPEPVQRLHWNYNQNVAVAGFPPNEALALVWQGFPGVVFDLDTFDDEDGEFDDLPYDQFEDLFFLAGINSYNRRCGWHGYQSTLSRAEVVANAEILILNDEGSGDILKRYPDHEPFASIPRDDGTIHLLRSTQPRPAYRDLYAREFLRRSPKLDPEETKVVGAQILLTAMLDGDGRRVDQIRNEFGLFKETSPPGRNLYWIGGYPSLLDFAASLPFD